jgi:hypothetical protein
MQPGLPKLAYDGVDEPFQVLAPAFRAGDSQLVHHALVGLLQLDEAGGAVRA